MKTRNGYIDLFKLIMSYLVIMIHFSYHPITRIAVPFFFMILGYFAYENNSDLNYKLEKAKKQIFNSLKYLLMGLLIYFIYDVIMLFVNKGSLMNYIRGLIYSNPIVDNLLLNKNVTSGYHLWFLFALVTVNIIHYFLVKYDKTKIYKSIWLPLLLINLVISVYLAPTVIGRVWEIEYTRNAILFGLPLFGLGYQIAKINLEKLKKYNWIMFVIAVAFTVLQTFENKIYLDIFNLEAEFFISSIIGGISFVIFFKNLKYNGQWFYSIADGKISFFVYIVHLMIGSIITKYFGIRSWDLTLITIAISTLLYFIIRWFIILLKIIVKNLKNNI